MTPPKSLDGHHHFVVESLLNVLHKYFTFWEEKLNPLGGRGVTGKTEFCKDIFPLVYAAKRGYIVFNILLKSKWTDS